MDPVTETSPIKHVQSPGPFLKPISSQAFRDKYELQPYSRWAPLAKLRNHSVILGVFLSLNAFLSEKLMWGAGSKTVTYFAKENKERKMLNERLKLKRERRQMKQIDEGSELKIESKAVLTWENFYDVPGASGKLRLLKDIFGYVRPAQLTTLMGASGAGKTTLLDILAGQQNVHEATQTAREALSFSAGLGQRFEVSREEKYSCAEEAISLLEMEDIADAIIGDSKTELAVEQLKPVAIGVELAAKPELLLFLDEPLDSQSAFNIVGFLKKLAAAGQCLLCAIHQPNARLFENFDRLLLLQRGGGCVYFGDMGQDAHVLLQCFRKNDTHCLPDANSAEWMLKLLEPRSGGFTRLFNHVAIALIAGLVYLNLDDSRNSLQERVFVIFQTSVVLALILAQVEPKYNL
ncbi:MAG: hypothetical protein Q9201_002307 [Fulgogasparrea decipioides]